MPLLSPRFNYQKRSIQGVNGYDVEVSPTLISEITADLDEEVKVWQTRRLEATYPILFLDGIVVHIRGESGQVREHTMYVALGVNFSGNKELLGLWLDETEGAKFWLACLTDLKNRGVNDLFLVCVDGLSGFPEAIQTAYPQAKVQLCIVHLVRAALRYVSSTDSRERTVKCILHERGGWLLVGAFGGMPMVLLTLALLAANGVDRPDAVGMRLEPAVGEQVV